MSDREEVARFQKAIDKSGFVRLLDIKILELEKDHAKGSMPFDEKYCNPYGSFHGGALYSLADTIAGVLADYAGCDVSTVEGSMHFLESVKDTEHVYCLANVKRSGGHLITVDVSITDDNDKLLDCGTYTFFRLTKSDTLAS